MSAVSRMLGRWRSGGCGCQTPGPDCAGHERDTRHRKRQEQRAVRAEIRDEAPRFHCDDPACDRCYADALDYEIYLSVMRDEEG